MKSFVSAVQFCLITGSSDDFFFEGTDFYFLSHVTHFPVSFSLSPSDLMSRVKPIPSFIILKSRNTIFHTSPLEPVSPPG